MSLLKVWFRKLCFTILFQAYTVNCGYWSSYASYSLLVCLISKNVRTPPSFLSMTPLGEIQCAHMCSGTSSKPTLPFNSLKSISHLFVYVVLNASLKLCVSMLPLYQCLIVMFSWFLQQFSPSTLRLVLFISLLNLSFIFHLNPHDVFCRIFNNATHHVGIYKK